jgi:protease IV
MAVWIISMIAAGIIGLLAGFEGEPSGTGNVALIPIDGTILTESSDSLFDTGSVSSSSIIRMIDDAEGDDSIKAIIFEINSPGGSPVASDEIGQRIKECKKPTVAYIRDEGASGAYWVASATDHIIANRMSITGSIGVYSSYIDFSGLIERYNMSYERLVSGKYKDMGSPYRDLSQEERQIFQKSLDQIRDYFIDEVAANRNLSRQNVSALATGQFYLGAEAKELGLIDELGGKEEAVQFIEKKLNIKVTLAEYRENAGFWDLFANAVNKNSFFIGRGIGSKISEDIGSGKSSLQIISV